MPPTITREAQDEDVPKHGALGHLSTDEELQQTVCEALINDPLLDSSEIRVRVVQDTARLSGRVKDAEARERAVAIASAQPGVAAVQTDELQCPGA